jgi:peptidoglycan/xylan/chitin deacetylase (PgdA/CDA1 family)
MAKKLISYDDQKPGLGLPDPIQGKLDKRFEGAFYSQLSAPTPLPAPQVKWLQTFQPGHGWTNPIGVGTIADDPSVSVMGTQSLRLDGGTARKTGLALDLTQNDLVILVKVGSLPSGSEMQVIASDVTTLERFASFSGLNSGPSPWQRDGDWVTLTIPRPVNEIGGAVDLSNIKVIQVKATGDAQVWVQAVGLAPKTQGVVSISFDDGYTSVIQAARRSMSPRGIRGTSYTIASSVGSGPNFMTMEETRELHDIHGWDIQAHTIIYYSEGGDNTDLLAEMRDTRKWIAENGFGSGEHFAYAGGQSGVENVLASRTLFRSARTISEEPESIPPGMPHKLRAYSSIGGLGGRSVTNIKALIDRTVTQGGWLHLVFHRIVEGASTRPEDCSFTDLDAILDHVVASGLPVKTVSEVL